MIALYFISLVCFCSVMVTQCRIYSAVDTILPVNDCPTTREKWIAASVKKNCSAISSPDGTTLLYHCVLNEWANATVEVCAANRIILLFAVLLQGISNVGKCSEYNYGAKRIQSSGMKSCSNFSTPCPTVYNSSDAYMYQGCYNFSTTINDVSESTYRPSPQSAGTSSLNVGIIVASVLFMAAVLVILGIAVYKWYYKRKRYNESDDSTESLNQS